METTVAIFDTCAVYIPLKGIGVNIPLETVEDLLKTLHCVYPDAEYEVTEQTAMGLVWTEHRFRVKE